MDDATEETSKKQTHATTVESAQSGPEARDAMASRPHDAYFEELYVEGESYFNELLASIAVANYSVDIECYMFENDALGQRVIGVLAEAVKRGVVVRVIIDAIGSDSATAVAALLSEAGVEVKIYHPLPWKLGHYKWSIKQGGFLQQLLYFATRINRRDHRKICIIDDDQLWTGSFNISVSHLSEHLGGGGWSDVGLHVQAGFVRQISDSFSALWHARNRPVRFNSFRRYLSNHSPVARLRKNQYFSQSIGAARHRVWIVTPYFSPTRVLLNAIKNAASRHVDVRLIVPRKSDVFFFPVLSASYFSDLLLSGVKIFEYQPGFLHAKTLICDDYFLVGSSNINHRSYFHDLELDLVLQNSASKRALEERCEMLMSNSIELSMSELQARPWRYRLGFLPRILRYWM